MIKSQRVAFDKLRPNGLFSLNPSPFALSLSKGSHEVSE
jgi:hypothetical protein